MLSEVSLALVAERHRYEMHFNDDFVGWVDYEDDGHDRRFVHAEVRSEYEGRGFGSRLVQFALGHARAEGRTVVPVCGFVRYVDEATDA